MTKQDFAIIAGALATSIALHAGAGAALGHFHLRARGHDVVEFDVKTPPPPPPVVTPPPVEEEKPKIVKKVAKTPPPDLAPPKKDEPPPKQE